MSNGTERPGDRPRAGDRRRLDRRRLLELLGATGVAGLAGCSGQGEEGTTTATTTEVEWQASQFNGGPRDVAVSEEPWDMSLNLQFNTYPFSPASSKGFFEKRGGINFYGYYPEADIASYYERATSTTDEAERKRLFGEAFGLISEEQPFGFLAMPSSITGYRSQLTGYGEEFNTGWDSQTWYFSQSNGGARSVGGDYRSASSADAQSLNWLTIADATSGSYITATLDGAWAIKPDQEVFPLWADYSTDDGRVYEIELRDNLQWGAGYGQMTAEDWVYMIKNVFQAEENWSGAPGASDWKRVNPDTDRSEPEPFPVEKTGKYTFEIRLFETDPSFPFKPVMWRQKCAPRELLEQYVPDRDAEGLQQDEELNTLAYTGNLGPYQFVDWERTSQYVVERNDEYYLREADDVPERFANAPYFDRQVVKVIKEEASRLGALESGDVDSAGVPPDKAARFENLSGVDLNVTPQPYIRILVYNMRANGWLPFRKKAVRQALAHAVDKRTIASDIYRGYAEVAHTMQPRWSKWYSDETVTEYGVGDRYGPEATRSALSSALEGEEYRYDGDTLVDGNGEPVTLTLTFDSGQSTEQTLAQFVAQEFQQNAGIAVELEGVSPSTYQDKYVKTSPSNRA